MNWNKGPKPSVRTSLTRGKKNGATKDQAAAGGSKQPALTSMQQWLRQSAGSESIGTTSDGSQINGDANTTPQAPESSMPDAASASAEQISTAVPAATSDDVADDEEELYGDSGAGEKPALMPAKREAQDESDDYDLGSDSASSDGDGDAGDGDVMINVEATGRSDIESGELTESEVEPSAAANKVNSTYATISTDKDAASDKEQDDMMRYADSTQVHAAPSVISSNPVRIVHPLPQAFHGFDGINEDTEQAFKGRRTTLGDLSPTSVRQQLRYFYIGVDPAAIPLTAPLFCNICGVAGHFVTDCELSTCSECGARDAHPRALCPMLHRCPRCLQRGHAEQACTSKLKVTAGDDSSIDTMPCALCGRSGHLEELCEALWRSSGRPWERDLEPGAARLFCFECGATGHLGNDCARRNPGKEPATSSWSLRPATRPPRPRVRQGQMRRGLPAAPPMAMVGQQRPDVPPGRAKEPWRWGPPPSGTAAASTGKQVESGGDTGPSGRDESSGEEFFRDRPAGRGRGEINIRGVASARARDTAGPSRGGTGRRGRGRPPKRGRGGSRGGSSGGEAYTPMPSAGAKAWRKGKT